MQRETIEKVLKILVDEEGGDWVLLGGALALLEFRSTRATEDIDLVSKDQDPQKRIRLMEIADRVGLSIESLNSAADFFLYRFPNWEKQLVEIRSGKKGRIYRPTKNLFCALKLARGSESDLEDCKIAIQSPGPDTYDPKMVQKWCKDLKIELKPVVKDFLKKLSLRTVS